LDGYRLLASAPTGIATLSLQAEGFEDVATCDRLLRELSDGGERLDARTVLVVDEAGMLGSRKLAGLLDYAERGGAKVVLVGDDRQLAPIDAGGGFRALRLRLGASELTENRRQRHAWEREALELVRSGLVEEAVATYQAHDRVVAADTKTAATLALLRDWWQAFQQAERDPAQEVVMLAARRAEVDRLNSNCQQLLDLKGRLGLERLQVEDRELAVGDRVVCGHNAIRQLGVANGTRGTVTALDPERRTLTIRTDGQDGREGTLPQWYLDGRGHGERNRRVDLAYATTGHRAQGLTRWRALVRLTGQEDVNWLYVQLSRARQETRLYAVVGPEPRGAGELDLPDRDATDAYLQLAHALSRPGSQALAMDTPSTLDLRQLSTKQLRGERDRLGAELDQYPKDRRRELERAAARRAEAEQTLAQLTSQPQQARRSGGMLGLLGRGHAVTQADPAVVTVATQQADRAAEREREVRQHQQRRDGWLEGHPQLGLAYRRVVGELAWQRRARGLAQEAIGQDRPGYLRELLGPVPESTRGRRVWRQAAGVVEQYRQAYDVHDQERPLGPEPREPAQRAAWQQVRTAVERVHGKHRAERERQRTHEPTNGRRAVANRQHPDPSLPPAQRGRRSGRLGPERAAG
jgi:hypothetical protein